MRLTILSSNPSSICGPQCSKCFRENLLFEKQQARYKIYLEGQAKADKGRSGSIYLQGEPKKRGIEDDMAITPLKSIRNGKSWCVSENSALMLQDMHQTFQI